MTSTPSTEFASLLEQIENDPIEARELAAADLGLKAILTLQQAMKESGMSQIDLATSLGVSESAVSQVMNGDGNLRMHTFARYLRALEFEVNLELQSVSKVASSITFQDQTSDKAEATSFEFSIPWVTFFHKALEPVTEFGNSSSINVQMENQLENALLWTPTYIASLDQVSHVSESHVGITVVTPVTHILHLVA